MREGLHLCAFKVWGQHCVTSSKFLSVLYIIAYTFSLFGVAMMTCNTAEEMNSSRVLQENKKVSRELWFLWFSEDYSYWYTSWILGFHLVSITAYHSNAIDMQRSNNDKWTTHLINTSVHPLVASWINVYIKSTAGKLSSMCPTLSSLAIHYPGMSPYCLAWLLFQALNASRSWSNNFMFLFVPVRVYCERKSYHLVFQFVFADPHLFENGIW